MKRNPHPARGSRVTALGVSATAFVSIVTGLAWNTHQAELVTNIADPNAVPVQQVIPVQGVITPAAASVTPAATIVTTAPSTAAKKNTPAKSMAPVAPTVAPATPVTPAAPAAPATAAVAPATPAATVVYTCMSPGGKTETPSASGACKNAKYGYVLTQI